MSPPQISRSLLLLLPTPSQLQALGLSSPTLRLPVPGGPSAGNRRFFWSLASSPFAPVCLGCGCVRFCLSLPPVHGKGPGWDKVRRAGTLGWMQPWPHPPGAWSSLRAVSGGLWLCVGNPLYSGWSSLGLPCPLSWSPPWARSDMPAPSPALPAWEDAFLLAMGLQSLLPAVLWGTALPWPLGKPGPQWIPQRCNLPAQPSLPRAWPCPRSFPSSSSSSL